MHGEKHSQADNRHIDVRVARPSAGARRCDCSTKKSRGEKNRENKEKREREKRKRRNLRLSRRSGPGRAIFRARAEAAALLNWLRIHWLRSSAATQQKESGASRLVVSFYFFLLILFVLCHCIATRPCTGSQPAREHRGDALTSSTWQRRQRETCDATGAASTALRFSHTHSSASIAAIAGAARPLSLLLDPAACPTLSEPLHGALLLACRTSN